MDLEVRASSPSRVSIPGRLYFVILCLTLFEFGGNYLQAHERSLCMIQRLLGRVGEAIVGTQCRKMPDKGKYSRCSGRDDPNLHSFSGGPATLVGLGQKTM